MLLHEMRNGRVSLAKVLEHIGSRQKGTFIANMAGKHWSDLTADPTLMMAWTGYTLNDVDGCRDIFFHLRERFPPEEAMQLDRLIKMATRPVLELDIDALRIYSNEVRIEKQQLLDRVMLKDKSALMSNVKFAQMLMDRGVEPPMKISMQTGKETYAFAKQDQAFVDLLEHDDIEVQMLVSARLGVKSTIEETRSQRLINIGTCSNEFLSAPLLPVPLKYSGAHTHRLSGDWQLNLQNLGARKSRAIRSAILAPQGYTIVAVDAAQIEARLTAWLAGEIILIQMFARGEDTYKAFAADIFRRALTLVSKSERFVGKQCILGLGFGMSAGKLYRTIINLAREQGITDIEITIELCQQWVDRYRSLFTRIRQCWWDLSGLLHKMMQGQADGMTFGPCVVEGTTIILPSGLRLYYDNLRKEDDEYFYDYGQFKKKIYGGKTLENVVQGLDRQHVMEAGIRTEIRALEMGIPDPRVLLNVHDENVYCVPDKYAELLAELALEEMKRSPTWGDGLPLSADVKLGKNFGDMQTWEP